MFTPAWQMLGVVLAQLAPGQELPPLPHVEPLKPAPIQGAFNPAEEETLPPTADLPQPTQTSPEPAAAPAAPVEGGAQSGSADLQWQPAGKVKRASAEAPLVPVEPSEADDLIEAADDLPEPAQQLPLAAIPQGLEGNPTSLVSALSGLGGRNQPLSVVKRYWRLSAAVARYQDASQQADFLAELSEPPAHQEAVLRAARAGAVADKQEARLAVVAAQSELADAALLSTAGWLPLPADEPLVGPYQTHFETLFAGRPEPVNLRRIDRALPHQQQVIEARSAAVQAAAEALEVVAEAYHEGQASLSELLDVHRLVQHQRQARRSAVLEYNEQIAEYALAVVGPGVAPETVDSMLIRRSRAASAAQQGVRLQRSMGSVVGSPASR